MNYSRTYGILTGKTWSPRQIYIADDILKCVLTEEKFELQFKLHGFFFHFVEEEGSVDEANDLEPYRR